jgi:hypothetical protein
VRETCDSAGRLGFNAHREQRQYPQKASPPIKIALPEFFKLFKFVHFIKKTAFTATLFVTSWP